MESTDRETLYVEQVLAPTLSAGEVVAMDNVRMHKVAGVREVSTAVRKFATVAAG
jgi:hypothetical protein